MISTKSRRATRVWGGPEPDRMTIVFSGGTDIRDRSYRLVQHPKVSRDTLPAAMQEMGRFYH